MAAYEALVLLIKKMKPDLPIVFVNTCAYLDKCANVNQIIKLVATQYGVPWVSFTDVATAVRDSASDPNIPHVYWGTGTHPRWEVHVAIADTLKSCLVSQWQPYCRIYSRPGHRGLPPPINPGLLDKLKVCDHPVVMYAAMTGMQPSGTNTSGLPPLSESGFSLVYERADKPGWISSKANATLSFPVRFGENPRLILTYLRSYANLGNAMMSFSHDPSKQLPLYGTYQPGETGYGSRVSQSFMIAMDVKRPTFQPSPTLNGLLGFGIPPGLATHVQFRAIEADVVGVNGSQVRSSKFKIISLSTC
ncbi:hypothetical protein DFJ74DRAFT_159294 [Hyaloraphidium curvatum]|nr:hypothetical protein DFJ74DRAFT_159294 [Hyaloraphidium curvatum]